MDQRDHSLIMTRNELGNPEPDGSGSGTDVTSHASDSRAPIDSASRSDARRGRQGADRGQAEPLSRGEYRDRIRDGSAPIQATDAVQHDNSRAIDGDISARNRDDAGPGQITHYHSEFNGQQLDLYTDDSRWAPGDRGQEGATPETGTLPETVFVQGKEVEVSGIAADGIWVDGLPGEMPGTPYGDPFGSAKVGDILASTEDTEKPMAEELRNVFIERAEDIVDVTEKDLNDAQQLFEPRPTHSGIEVPVAHSGTERPYHEIDAGNAATAILALGFAVWGIHHIWQRWNDQRRDRETHLDGGN